MCGAGGPHHPPHRLSTSIFTPDISALLSLSRTHSPMGLQVQPQGLNVQPILIYLGPIGVNVQPQGE